jgi:hypothetical protein
VPDELVARGVTPETADHNDQISDYGFDLGGPIVRDRAWAWGSWTKQDIRLIRSAGAILDRTILKTYNLKGNWQASKNDMISVLWFNGEKQKFGRGTGDAQVLAPSATWNQGNRYPDGRPHGLLQVREQPRLLAHLLPVEQMRLLRHGIQSGAGGWSGRPGSVSTRLGEATEPPARCGS